MPTIAAEDLLLKKAFVEGLDRERNQWRLLWRELADFYLPNRYMWLLTDKERAASRARNEYILDSTGTSAARTLAAGLMNGITSPSRPWFKLRIPGSYDQRNKRIREWLDEVERRLAIIFAESNFYNAMQILYLDLAVFGTAGILIYEDADSIIRCYNVALGEYYLANSARQTVDTFARKFTMPARAVMQQFPDESYWSDYLKNLKLKGGAALLEPVHLCHLVEPNEGKIVGSRFKFQELYWEANASTNNKLLGAAGFYEFPGIFPRWELSPGAAYGVSPGMDGLGDVIQLQQETKRKAQGLDKMVSPPLILPIELQNRPTALMPGGVTYVSGSSNVKAESVYNVNIPIQDLAMDIAAVQERIRNTFYNSLFNGVSNLSTVRSAKEIEVRQEERLVLLGGVLERVENEGIDPSITRTFNIAQRMGLMPDPPEELESAEVEIQYVSILSVAQRAVATIPTERLLQLTGQLAGVYPEATQIPNIPQLVRDYAIDIGVRATGINSEEEVAARLVAKQQQEATAQSLAAAESASKSATNLAQAEVGGGQNALQMLLGN